MAGSAQASHSEKRSNEVDARNGPSTEPALPHLPEHDAQPAVASNEAPAVGILVNQGNSVESFQQGSSVVALSRIENVRVSNTDGVGILLNQVALRDSRTQPESARPLPILNSRITGSKGIGVLGWNSAVDLVSNAVSGSKGAGVLGVGMFGILALNEITDTSLAEIAGETVADGIVLSGNGGCGQNSTQPVPGYNYSRIESPIPSASPRWFMAIVSCRCR